MSEVKWEQKIFYFKTRISGQNEYFFIIVVVVDAAAVVTKYKTIALSFISCKNH